MPPRAPLFAMLAATLTLFSPLSAHSQTATDPAEPSRKTDFAFMAAKAKTDPELGQLFRQIESMRQSRPKSSDDMVSQMLQASIGGNYDPLKPVAYLERVEVEQANQRAQILSRILAVDLNNDWAITLTEIKTALKYGRQGMAAETFITYDADSDMTLSTDEIRGAIDAELETQYGKRNGSKNRAGIAALFDFDDDGILIPEEYQRGIEALK